MGGKSSKVADGRPSRTRLRFRSKFKKSKAEAPVVLSNNGHSDEVRVNEPRSIIIAPEEPDDLKSDAATTSNTPIPISRVPEDMLPTSPVLKVTRKPVPVTIHEASAASSQEAQSTPILNEQEIETPNEKPVANTSTPETEPETDLEATEAGTPKLLPTSEVAPIITSASTTDISNLAANESAASPANQAPPPSPLIEKAPRPTSPTRHASSPVAFSSNYNTRSPIPVAVNYKFIDGTWRAVPTGYSSYHSPSSMTPDQRRSQLRMGSGGSSLGYQSSSFTGSGMLRWD